MGGGGSNPPSKYGWDIILYLHLGDFPAMFNPLILFVSFLKGVVCARNFYFIGLFGKNVEKLLHRDSSIKAILKMVLGANPTTFFCTDKCLNTELNFK